MRQLWVRFSLRREDLDDLAFKEELKKDLKDQLSDHTKKRAALAKVVKDKKRRILKF